LAITAILTTILGSYLALLSTVNDFVQKSRKKDINHDDGEVSDSSMQKSQGDNSPWHRMKVASIITVPASLIACSSPSVFLKAIDFAGSYPVLMLWGVAPPLMALIQRSRDDKGTSKFKTTAGPSVWLAVLALLAIGMIGFSAIGDMASFVNKFKIL
jgi:amino acid permease